MHALEQLAPCEAKAAGHDECHSLLPAGVFYFPWTSVTYCACQPFGVIQHRAHNTLLQQKSSYSSSSTNNIPDLAAMT